MTRRFPVLTITSCIAAAACAGSASAVTIFAIPAQDLSAALKAFASQSGVPIVASADLVRGRPGQAAIGSMTAERALDHILAGSGLHAAWIDGAWVVKANPVPAIPKDVQPDITVTGTRIRGAGPVGSPVIVLDHKAIEQSGRATLSDYIQTIPQNFGGSANESLTGTTARNNANSNVNYGASIDLRGLGSNSTLVLFDGSRPALGGVYGAFTDISVIPTVAVDRIEILTDGASAIYGSDAVAGVVNIRFRDRLDGFETHVYSGTAGGAFGQFQVAQAAGKRWSNGGVMIAYQYDQRGKLAGADRKASTEDLTPFGGPDNRSLYANSANIVAADGSVYAVSPAANTAHLTSADLTAGATNRVDNQKLVDLLPRQRTHSIYAAADQEIVPQASLFVRGLFTHRTFALDVLPYEGQVILTSASPYYIDPTGTGEPIAIERSYREDVGQAHDQGVTQAYSITGGVQGDVRRWHYEVSGSYGRQVETQHLSNYLNYARLQALIDNPDPGQAINPFAPLDAAAAQAARGSVDGTSRYSVWSAAARLDGPLFELPAGSAKLAIGAEHRHESFIARGSDDVYLPDFESYDIAGTPAARHIDAVYAELLLPVFDAHGGFPGKLDLSAAGRIEHYSDVGRTNNPKLGLSWTPVAGLTLRGSYGTSFRAPGFTENTGSSANLYEPLLIPDPTSPIGETAVLGKFGNADHIGPERARTWTMGFDLHPPQLKGLTLSASYFDIAYRDRIASASFDYQSFLVERTVFGGLIEDNPSAAEVARYYALPGFANPFGIAQGDIKAIIDGETRNLSRLTVRGVDFNLDFHQPAFGGTIAAGLAGTRLLAMDQKITDGAPADDILGTFGNPVKLRMRGHIGWSNAQVDATVSANYTAGYANDTVTPVEHVHTWTTIDAQLGYTFDRPTPFGRAHIALNAINLFDRAPPYVNNTSFNSTLAYDPGQASAIGRVVSIEATFGW
jgi:outer membrane receptor protein involved in Fe transport